MKLFGRNPLMRLKINDQVILCEEYPDPQKCYVNFSNYIIIKCVFRVEEHRMFRKARFDSNLLAQNHV
jgi:hypothetical protein